MDRPDWTYWLNRTLVEVKDACALSCDVSPEAFDKIDGRFVPTREAEAYREITRRIELANDAIRAGNLETRHARGPYYDREVALSEFRRWGESLPFPATFPAEFPAATPKPEAALPAANTWPWGTHETELLRHLAAAVGRFWKNYDPTDATTAPTNEEVVAWLVARGVANRNAQVMARMLRADGLPTGPRK